MALTLIASEAGLKIVDKARSQKGYNKTNAVNWQDNAGVSRATFDKFWARKGIKHDNFVAICTAVGVDWQTVVEQDDRDSNDPRQVEVSKLEKFNGLKIAKQIHDWLTALRYEFEAHEDFQSEYCEFIIRIPVRRGRFDRILIRGVPSEAKIKDLQNLQSSVDKHQTDEGWLIVNRRISPAVQTELAKDENQHLSCMTFDELIDQDADFEPYLTWLEDEVIKRGIDRKYVSLACDKEEIDPVTQHSIATSKYGEAEGWIEGYIKQWLSDDSKEHVSILGEFGTGKTWFSFHYAWDCLRAYKEAKEQGLERPRLPLVIALRDYNKALKVESVLSDLFFNKHDIRLNSSVFDCLNQMGKLVIIFDGFDEMADKVDRQKMINNFWELARVVCPGSKVILTSRTEHFPHDRESRQLLNAELESSTAKLKWESPRFELLELAKFNETQIRHVLTLEAEEKGLSTDIVEKVMVRSELLDLARRPVMTELIIEAMPEIEAGKPVDMSRIYYYAIVRKMDRDIKAERTFTSLADKLYFLCEIAWEMLSTERMKLNYREFPDRIRQIFPQLVTEAKDLDHWHYDMMGQTILIRNADGDYTPAHRSLLEFLVAYKFAAEAGVLKADFVAAVQQQMDCIDGDAMPEFYTWTGYLQACVKAKCEKKTIAPLQGFIPESSEYLRRTFGREPLTKAVIDLIVPMLELKVPTLKGMQDKSENSLLKIIHVTKGMLKLKVPVLREMPNESVNPLLKIIHGTKSKTEAEVGWLGGNAATLLVKWNPAALDCEDLSYTQMANSDLVDANLQRVNFTGTNLKNSLFMSILSSAANAVSISQDGKFFATGHDDGIARFWDVIEGQLLYTYSGNKKSITSVAIEIEKNWLVTGSFDGAVKRLDILTGECLQTYLGHKESVKSIALEIGKNWFMTGGIDGTVKRWDMLTGECLQTYSGHQGLLAIGPEGNWFITGDSKDTTVKRWDILTGECLQTYSGHQKTGYGNSVQSIVIAPEGNWLVTGDREGTIKRWDVLTGECLQTYSRHSHSIMAVAIAPTGNWLIICVNSYSDKNWSLIRRDIATGLYLQTYAEYQFLTFTSLAIATEGDWLVSGSFDRTLKCWDIVTGKLWQIYSGHQAPITAVAISPNGNWLVSGSDDRTIKRWDTLTGQCLQTYSGHGDWIWAVVIAPEGKWLVSGSVDRTIKRWDTLTGQCLQTYSGHQNSVGAVAISPKGDWLVSGSDDGTIKRWDTLTGKCLQTYSGHQNSVGAVAISPEDNWLISGSGDKLLKRWDTYTGKCLKTYSGHEGWVWAVAMAPEGNWLVSDSADKTLKRWDTSTGKCLKTYSGHGSSISAVVISSDGYYIISSAGGEIKTWNVQTGECIRTVSNRPCEGMRIGGAKELTSGQIESLKALGAVDD
jgi:WD40 repeat protein